MRRRCRQYGSIHVEFVGFLAFWYFFPAGWIWRWILELRCGVVSIRKLGRLWRAGGESPTDRQVDLACPLLSILLCCAVLCGASLCGAGGWRLGKNGMVGKRQ